MEIRGKVRVDYRTKDLAKRLCLGDIAVIAHSDLDELAAESLVEKGVKAVINTKASMTCKYPNGGPKVLLRAAIPLIDCDNQDIMNNLKDGDKIIIKNNTIWHSNKIIGKGQIINGSKIEKLLKITEKNIDQQLTEFINNTLNYALKEKDLILNRITYPTLKTKIKGRQVVIVVRGQGYKKDLLTIKSYFKEVKPVLIGVDGGADALIELGFQPDIIIGDMDSVSDKALRANVERIVHTYTNGEGPGINRLKALGLDFISFPAPGTSEDIALLLAYEKGAELIVAVGTHTNMIDFLEKGRKGMASTFLVRLKVGSRLVDAKGVSKLYKTNFNKKYFIHLFLAGLVPLLSLIYLSPIFNQFYRILVLKLRFLLKI